MAAYTVAISVNGSGDVSVSDYHLYAQVGDTVTWTCQDYSFTIRFTNRWPVTGTTRGELRVPKTGSTPYTTGSKTIPSAGLGSHPYWVLVNWPNASGHDEIRVLNQPDIIVE